MRIIEKIVKSATDLDAPHATIAFLGDSVTQGWFRLGTDYDAVYHNRIRQIFGLLYPNAVINIINAGICGTEASFGLDRIERDVLDKNPDMCVVSFGLNDVNGKREGLEKYGEALEGIFKRLQEKNIEVIFMTPNMLNSEITDCIPSQHLEYASVTKEYQDSGLMDEYMEVARKTAKKCGVPVCDCYAKWKLLAESGVSTTNLLSNGINHPIAQMHYLFAISLIETMMTC